MSEVRIPTRCIHTAAEWKQAWQAADTENVALGLLHTMWKIDHKDPKEVAAVVDSLVRIADKARPEKLSENIAEWSNVLVAVEQQTVNTWMRSRVPLSPDFIRTHLVLLVEFLGKERWFVLGKSYLEVISSYLESFFRPRDDRDEEEKREKLLASIHDHVVLAACRWGLTEVLAERGTLSTASLMSKFLRSYGFPTRIVLRRPETLWLLPNHLVKGLAFVDWSKRRTGFALIVLLARLGEWGKLQLMINKA